MSCPRRNRRSSTSSAPPCGRSWCRKGTRGVAEVGHRLRRQRRLHRGDHGESAEPRVEDTDGAHGRKVAATFDGCNDRRAPGFSPALPMAAPESAPPVTPPIRCQNAPPDTSPDALAAAGLDGAFALLAAAEAGRGDRRDAARDRAGGGPTVRRGLASSAGRREPVDRADAAPPRGERRAPVLARVGLLAVCCGARADKSTFRRRRAAATRTSGSTPSRWSASRCRARRCAGPRCCTTSARCRRAPSPPTVACTSTATARWARGCSTRCRVAWRSDCRSGGR